MDILDQSILIAFTLDLAAKIREDYGHSITEWPELSRDRATDLIVRMHQDGISIPTAAFKIVNDYAKNGAE